METFIRLLRIPELQLANRQYPILSINGVPAPDVLETISYAQVSGNLIQRIKLPYSDHMELVNMVDIGGHFYNVISVDNVTYDEQESVLDLIFNPVTSYIRTNDSLTGWWERTPSLMHRIDNVQFANDTLVPTNRVNFPEITRLDSSYKYMWVRITSNFSILQPAFTGGIFQYGYFIAWKDTKSSLIVKDSTGQYFPNLESIMGDSELNCDIPADSILDISISPRCPFKYDQTGDYYRLKDINGATILALDNQNVGNLVYYHLGTAGILPNPENETERTITLTPFERYCGRVTIVDELGNEIGVVPNQWFDVNRQLTYKIKSINDMTGIYTHVYIKNKLFMVPEGHLPWIGSAWNEYYSRNYAYDREALTLAVDTVNKQKSIDDTNAIAGSMLTTAFGGGPLGVAQMGLGLIASDKTRELNINNLYASQRIKEGRIKSAPSTNYQVGFGNDFPISSFMSGGAHFRIETPANLTSTDFDNFIAYYGWPCGKYGSLTAVTGYIRGNVTSWPTDNVGNGQKMDMLRKEIADGFRMVSI